MTALKPLLGSLLGSFPAAVAALVAGVVLVQQWASLPDPRWGWLLPLLLLALRVAALRLVAALGIGVLWALLYAHLQLRGGIAAELEGVDLEVVGVVASLPDVTSRRTRFHFAVEQMSRDGESLPLPGRIRIACYDCGVEALVPGERYRLTVRLRQPSGLMNPGGFDYEGWLFRQRIQATGYIRASGESAPLGEVATGYALLRLRERLRQVILQQAPGPSAGMMVALAVGERSTIPRDHWEVYTRAGINHLVAISGLHIGIVIGLGYAVGRWLWSRHPRWPLRLPAQQAGVLLGLAAALGYAALAGFAVPTQRALMMALVLLGGVLWGRQLRPSRSLALALLVVVVWDPLAVLSAGFWLSFAAVAIIFYLFTARLRRPGRLRSWWRIQWGIGLLLAPLLVAQGLQVALLGPLINLLLVPIFSLLIVPGVLLGVVLALVAPPLGGPLLRLLGWVLEHLHHALAELVSHPWATWQAAQAPPLVWFCALFGLLWLFAPKGLPGRILGVVWLLPLLLWQPPRPPPGEAWVTLLDVGQGLALVVETAQHRMVYDTGPRFSADFDAGSAVVAPFLLARGYREIDLLMLSHGDSDHVGGVAGLLAKISAAAVVSGEPQRLARYRATPCRKGQRWHWDGVDFALLHPDDAPAWRGNEASCVLRIAVGERALLLPGDIERWGELRLVLEQPEALRADLLVAPHHGSLTSSTPPFVEAVAPQWVLFAVGHGNRFGFPREAVVERWQQVGATVVSTDQQGALQFRLNAAGVSPPVGYRSQARRYWHR